MDTFFPTVLTTSIHGSIVILAVLLLRLVLKKAPKKTICWLWVLAGIRLLLPVPIESAYSLQPQQIHIALPANLRTILAAIWIVLAIAIGLYSVFSYIHLRRKVMDAVKIPGGWESDRIETAFVLGFIKPKIYIPTGMPSETRNQILAHERTHLDKGDHWIKMIGFLALAVHWFNPLVWVSYILLCKDIEMACDERVVQFMELDERKTYSAALLRCSTNRAHYAACPVAFGEISVKYRIKSILNYRKPSFWITLLALVAFIFVGVCLMTSPQTVVEVPVDADAPLREISQEDPKDFVPAQAPEMEENPDWGVEIIMDVTSPTGGTLVYVVEERYAATYGTIEMKESYLEQWNGTAWEPVTSRSNQVKLLDISYITFAHSRDMAAEFYESDLSWTLDYGPLPSGDYRLCQTLGNTVESAVFYAPFHIYREKLPAEEEAALERCETALAAISSKSDYSVLLSETAPYGGIQPVQQITKSITGGQVRVDHYVGDYCVSSNNSEDAQYAVNRWQAPFRLDQNRRFLFPEGKSVISQEEITFYSVWSDYKGTVYQGMDTYKFSEDGTLASVNRVVQTMDKSGNVASEFVNHLEVVDMGGSYQYAIYVQSVGDYTVQDAADAMNDSSWGIFFRVDDDYLAPGSGEIWLGVDAVGVSNYTTDGNYWLEKKVGSHWERLGSEQVTASWGDESIQLSSQTQVRQVDWTDTYGELDAGVYRMGKHFYKGDDSIIQYAEFAIYQTGGIFGEGAKEAIARVDAAIEKLQQGNYRVEVHASGYSDYDAKSHMTDVIWKYGTTQVRDYYNKVENYSHSYVCEPGDFMYGEWFLRSHTPSEYESVYFPAGYSIISDCEITLVHSYSQNAVYNPCTIYTYRFDEAGNLTEIQTTSMDFMWSGHVTRYVVTDPPESEIQAWVEAKKAEK